jgi:hypothetical protein
VAIGNKISQIYEKLQSIKYSDRKPISNESLKQFAKSLGIKNIQIKTKSGRTHMVLFGDLEGAQIVFKINADPKHVSRTLSEIRALINLSGTINKEFSAPKLLDYDLTNETYLWFITEYAGNKYLTGSNPNDAEVLARATLAIIRSSLKIPNRDKKRLDLINQGKSHELIEKLNRIADKWHEKFTDDITDLKDIMNAYPVLEVPVVSLHGDLVPRHIIDLDNGKYQIYDWELSGGAWFWGYEPAYVFHRLYTRQKDSTLATHYLKYLFNNMGPREKDLLKKTFKHMLAQRIIGGYLDYPDKDSGTYKLNKILHRQLSSADIIFLP